MDAESRLGDRLAEETDVESPCRSCAAPGTVEISCSDSRTRGYAERNALQQVRHHHQHPDHHVADVERAQLAAAERVDPVHAALELAERLPGGLEERGAGLGQLDVAAGAEKQRRVPTASSSARIFWLRNGWAMPSRTAARPKCSSSARIAK